MQILHLITRMDRGGSAVNTLISAAEQQRTGHAVTLAFGPSLESEMGCDERQQVEKGLAEFRHLGGVVVCIPSLMRNPGGHDIAAFRQIRRLVKSGFDMVHTHTSKAGALGRLAASGTAVVHTPHGHIFHNYFGGLKTRVFIAIERYLASRSDALIALTQAEMEDHLALGIGFASQWHVVPSGVDVKGIAGRVAELRGEAEPKWDAVSVGRLVPVKGMERLIRAWKHVVAQKPDARLAIVGDGGERERLEALQAQLGLEDAIHFAGWADPLPYLAGARVFALLSYNEGMGRAAVEALAASLPCVVSDVCGLREVVTPDVGMVVSGDDATAVAGALLHRWSPEIGAQSRARADAYSVHAMVNGLEKIYREVQRP